MSDSLEDQKSTKYKITHIRINLFNSIRFVTSMVENVSILFLQYHDLHSFKNTQSQPRYFLTFWEVHTLYKINIMIVNNCESLFRRSQDCWAGDPRFCGIFARRSRKIGHICKKFKIFPRLGPCPLLDYIRNSLHINTHTSVD